MSIIIKILSLRKIEQGMVDGSACKPALRQVTGYMVEKTYHLAQYLGPFGTYFMPQGPKVNLFRKGIFSKLLSLYALYAL